MGRVLADLLKFFGKSNLALRLLTAAILVPAYYVVAKIGGMPYASFVMLGIMWAGYEWLAMVNPEGRKSVWVPVLFTLALTWGIAIHSDDGRSVALTLCLVSSLLLMAAFRTMKVKKPVLLSMAVSYLGASMLGMIALRELGPKIGFDLTFFLCSTVWLTDTGAYFCGKTLRGARLAPDISPSKTWAGFFGGLIGGQAAVLLNFLLFKPADLGIVSVMACFLSLAAQCGDLFESWVKRQAGVKNSGAVIPGHGGLLDRIDALIMATILFWVALWAMNYDLSWWKA
jgi:phosphatidate cytidylyltransferase